MPNAPFARIAADRSPDAVCVLDPEGIVLYANQALADLFDVSREDLVGISYLDVVDPAQRHAAEMGLRAVMNGHPDIREARRRLGLQNGKDRWIRVRARRTSWNGQPVIVGTARDVGEAMRQENELASAKEFLDRLIEVSPMVAFRRAGPDLELTYVSPNVTDVFGFDMDHVVGSGIETGIERAHPNDRGKMRDQIQRALSGESVQITYRIRTADGNYRWVVSTLRPDPAPSEDDAVLGYMFDITRQREVEQELEWLAFHDPLTGLANRSKFESDAAIHLSLSDRKGWHTALLYIDLDRFKEVNDTYGHEAGDEVLRTLAERMRDEVRDGDITARLGGDEFVILLPDVGDDAEAIARRVHDALITPVDVDGTETSVGASIGMAFFPEDGTDLDLLRKRADDAMYAAKRRRARYLRWSQLVDPGSED